MTKTRKIDFEKIKKAAIASLKNPGKRSKPLKKEKGPEIFVFRHAQSKDNIRKIFSGRRDTDLTKQGLMQAKKLARKLKTKRINIIIYSPLKRCSKTIKPLKTLFPKAELIKEPTLLERDYGSLTGTSKEKIMRENFEMAILYRRSYDTPPPNGESIKEVKEKRIDPFCKKLIAEFVGKDKKIAICCTNNTMRLIRMFFEDLTIEEMLTLENPFGDYVAYDLDRFS